MTDSANTPILKPDGPAEHTSESPPSADIPASRNAPSSEVETGAAVHAAHAEFVEGSDLVVPNGVDASFDGNATDNAEDPKSKVTRTNASIAAAANMSLSDGDIDAMMRELGWESRGRGAATTSTKLSTNQRRGTGPPESEGKKDAKNDAKNAISRGARGVQTAPVDTRKSMTEKTT